MINRINVPDEDTIPNRKKKILITGAKSYIGETVKDYLTSNNRDMYEVDVLDTFGLVPTPHDFAGYDVVFNVAGIVHIKESDNNRKLYFDVNRDLVINIAKSVKEARVEQFILLSSMSVYGKTIGQITKQTEEKPINAYGQSKAEADAAIAAMEDDNFVVSIIRPPMVYGKGCKGNYQLLRKFALKAPFFPKYNNTRSMIYVENLAEFVKRLIDRKQGGLFLPQNVEYVNTSEMVGMVANINGKKIVEVRIFNWAIKLLPVKILKKVFGNLCYEKDDLVSKISFEESIRRTEVGG